MEIFKKIGKIAIPIALLTLPLMTLALPQPTNPIPGTGTSLVELEVIIKRIATFLIVISIVVAVGAIVWGSVLLMTAGGSEDRSTSGKGFIKNGIIGALVVFLIGVILQTISGVVARTFFN